MKTADFAVMAAAGLVISMAAGCETARQALQLQKPSVALRGLGFGEVGLESATLLFDVEVGNPYTVPLPLTNMEYVLTTGARPMFSGKADLAQTIGAKDKAVVMLPATVSYLDVIQAFKDVRPGATIPYKANMRLSMDAPALGAIGMPLAKEGQLTVPAIPSLDSIDLKSRALEILRNQ